MGHMGQAGIKTCCLYICLIFLSSVILLTSFTIQWILYSIQFSLEGVGVVSLVEGGLKISGQTHIMDSMYASRISSVRRVPLRLVSDGNFSVNINNKNKNIHTDLLLEKAGFRVTADQMVVTDSNKKTLFSSSGRETVIGSDRVILSAQAGVSVKESLATKAVRSPAGHSLSLESTTSSLALLAPAGVDITSQSGHVNIQAYRDVMFRARGHNSQFRIDAGTILLPGLPTLARRLLSTRHPVLPAPSVSWECEWKPRTDSDCERSAWLTATEYEDQEEVLRVKVKQLAELLTLSTKTIIYSGAGISTAAGIAPAARSSLDSLASDLTTDALPSFTHRALAALRHKGLVADWVQQNHDGLPQKSGYPQEDVIEVHGSWYDPANPVICYEGTLRRDVFTRMKEAKYSADLVLVIGTSLSGLSCDKVAMEASDRSLEAEALGSVIINHQQTEQDGVASLRIFANIDDVFRALLQELDLSIDETILWKEPPNTRVSVPYNRNGVRSHKLRMIIDLTAGNKIRLYPGHNCQAQEFQVVCRPPGPGRGTVKGYLPGLFAWEIEIEGVTLLLGGWWLETSARGELEVIPVMNLDPEMGYLDTESGDWIWDNFEKAKEIAVEEELLHKQMLVRQKDEEEAAVSNAHEKLEDIEDETVQVEEIMKKALANMQKTQDLVNSIRCTLDFSDEPIKSDYDNVNR